jgi:hypothetical protein
MKIRTVRIEVTSEAPASALYRLLADGRSWPAWADLEECEPEGVAPGVPESVGTVRRSKRGRTVGFDLVTELVPDRRLGYEHVKGLPVRDYVASVDLAPAQDGGTTIVWQASFKPKIPGTGLLLQRGIEEFLGNCARGLATHASPAEGRA